MKKNTSEKSESLILKIKQENKENKNKEPMGKKTKIMKVSCMENEGSSLKLKITETKNTAKDQN